MEDDIIKKIEEQGKILEEIWKSVEKTRKYFLVVFWVTIIAFVLPLIAAVFVVPYFISSYLGALGSLGL